MKVPRILMLLLVLWFSLGVGGNPPGARETQRRPVSPAHTGQRDKAGKPAKQPSSAPTKNFRIHFDDPQYDFELQRTIGYTLAGGADINECLFTAGRIQAGNDESWYTAWRATGDRIYAIGEKCLAGGHRVSAREAFLRASNYFRTAEFFLHSNPHDPRILKTWGLSRKAFRRAAALMDHPVEIIKIPYAGTALPGYFCRPDASTKPRKTLIVHTGFDGTGEELYLEVAFFALARGYNVLIFEGPGQGGALREQHLYFRPDWEKVVTPVVDYALTRPEIDPQRLTLWGISMGGYLAPRGAAFEPRLAALIANTGLYDLAEGQSQGKKPGDRLTREELLKNPDKINQEMYRLMQANPLMRWLINQGMFAFGKKTPAEFLLAQRDYHLRGVAPRIKCPTLVIDNEGDLFSHGQARQLFEALTCPKTFMLFTRGDMASSHCQMGALAISNQRILDWLDKTNPSSPLSSPPPGRK
jgi:alpha-beta hydrolase superfamily lysophospholipase